MSDFNPSFENYEIESKQGLRPSGNTEKSKQFSMEETKKAEKDIDDVGNQISSELVGSKEKPFTSIGDIKTIIQNTHYILDQEGASVAYFSFRNEKYRIQRDYSISPADSDKTIEPYLKEIFTEAVLEIKTKRERD
jgi:hypothetical protein